MAWIDTTPLGNGDHILSARVNDPETPDAWHEVARVPIQVRNSPWPYAETFADAIQAGRVMERNDIYCSGPPNEAANGLVLEFIRRFGAGNSLLDFGCGIGVYVDALAQQGLDAQGVEVNAEYVARGQAMGRRVQHYDGYTLPFADDSFDTVIAIEVLEHIPHWEHSLAEICRVARRRVILSVPNIESVTRMAPHMVVPWHLLESTHVNFFTPDALAHRLCRLPNTGVRVFTYGDVRINGAVYPNHVAAVLDLEHPHAPRLDYLEDSGGRHPRQIAHPQSDIRPMSQLDIVHRIKLHYEHGGWTHVGREIVKTLRRKLNA